MAEGAVEEQDEQAQAEVGASPQPRASINGTADRGGTRTPPERASSSVSDVSAPGKAPNQPGRTGPDAELLCADSQQSVDSADEFETVKLQLAATRTELDVLRQELAWQSSVRHEIVEQLLAASNDECKANQEQFLNLFSERSLKFLTELREESSNRLSEAEKSLHKSHSRQLAEQMGELKEKVATETANTERTMRQLSCNFERFLETKVAQESTELIKANKHNGDHLKSEIDEMCKAKINEVESQINGLKRDMQQKCDSINERINQEKDNFMNYQKNKKEGCIIC